HIETVGVRRQGAGTAGRAVTIRVNAFEATVPDEVIRHYDAIEDDKLPPRVNMRVWTTLMEDIAPDVFKNGKIPFDGKKNAYATYDLPLGPTNSASFQIPFAPTKAGKAPKIRHVKVTKVSEINAEFVSSCLNISLGVKLTIYLRLLHRFIAGKQSQDNTVSTAIMALNVAIQMEPKRNYPFNSRSFFTPDGAHQIGKGLELWRGYFQSIRPAAGRMYVNVDIATGLMYKPGPVISVALEYFEWRSQDVNRLNDLTSNDRQRLQLSRFLLGARITLTYGPKREFSVKGLSKNGASTASFKDREGKTITVSNYFRSLGKPLRFPDFPCIEVRHFGIFILTSLFVIPFQIGNGALIPMELCNIIPGQFCRRPIPSDKTSDMVDFSKAPPAQRLNMINEKGRQLLSYGQSEYVRQFGINISDSVMELRARILETPVVRYANPRDAVTPRDGSWNLRNQKLFKPVEIGDWALVVFEERRFSFEDAKAMAKDFVENAKILGIKFTGSTEVPLIEQKSSQSNISAALKAVGMKIFQKTKKPPSLMVAVLPDMGNTGLYTAIKHFGDIEMGVATQCLKAGKCKRAKPQYWANVLLKVNAKMGGVNSILQQDPLVDPNQPTMVMGADVKHPSPGTVGKPSFSALVASTDPQCSHYTAVARAQTGRQEIIEDLKEMCLEAFDAARQKGSRPPTRIIFYRDGVSEGQFAQVLQDEVPLIKAACKEKNINAKLTFIIVGKRHHIRFFPMENQGDKTGNCIAGTTVDTGIAHPTEFDYYQLTHGGLLGTSRPAHYSVLVDENRFTPDGLQKISFALCHVYARATRSVSIPAPVYYADIVCARSNTHYEPTEFGYGDDDTVIPSGSIEGALQKSKDGFKRLHRNMMNRMYFM
ncbi:hypothetical protein CVT24_007534, partial [Panaeolus cyanescens]